MALTYLNIQQSASSIHLREHPIREEELNSCMRLASGAGPELKGLNLPFLAR